jgi:hypothetical protein
MYSLWQNLSFCSTKFHPMTLEFVLLWKWILIENVWTKVWYFMDEYSLWQDPSLDTIFFLLFHVILYLVPDRTTNEKLFSAKTKLQPPPYHSQTKASITLMFYMNISCNKTFGTNVFDLVTFVFHLHFLFKSQAFVVRFVWLVHIWRRCYQTFAL